MLEPKVGSADMEWMLAATVLWAVYVLREVVMKMGRTTLRKAVRALRELAWLILVATLPEGGKLTERHEDGSVRIVSKPTHGRSRQ